MSKLPPGVAESLHGLMHDGMLDQLEPFPRQSIESGERHGAMQHCNVLNGFMPAGQISGIIFDARPAGDVVRRHIEEEGEACGSLGEGILAFSESLSPTR